MAVPAAEKRVHLVYEFITACTRMALHATRGARGIPIEHIVTRFLVEFVEGLLKLERGELVVAITVRVDEQLHRLGHGLSGVVEHLDQVVVLVEADLARFVDVCFLKQLCFNKLAFKHKTYHPH